MSTDARGHRRPPGRHGGARHLAGHQPRRRHQRRAAVTTTRSSRPARPPPSAAAGCSPPSSPGSEGPAMTYAGRHGRPTTLHSRPARARAARGGQAWVADDPDPTTRAELGAARSPRAKTGDGRGARGPRRPVRRDAGVRHRRAARRARRRAQPDEPRGGHPGGGRPRGLPRGARRRAVRRHRLRRAAQVRRLRPRHRRSRGRRGRPGGGAAAHRCRPPCWPSRSATSAPTPA